MKQVVSAFIAFIFMSNLTFANIIYTIAQPNILSLVASVGGVWMAYQYFKDFEKVV